MSVLSLLSMWLFLHFCLFHVIARTVFLQPRLPPPAPSHSHKHLSLGSAGGEAGSSPQEGRGEKGMPCRQPQLALGNSTSCSENLTLPRRVSPVPETPCASFCCSCCRRDAPAMPLPLSLYHSQGLIESNHMPCVLMSVCPREHSLPLSRGSAPAQLHGQEHHTVVSHLALVYLTPSCS